MYNLANEIDLFLKQLRINEKADVYAMNNDIGRAYSEHHRHYHDLWHLENCFKEFDETQYLFSPGNALLMKYALLYHDYVYIPGYKNNESASSEKALLDAMELGIDTKKFGTINAAISATTHTGEEYCYLLSCEKDLLIKDIMLVADIDLAILGQDKKIFLKYEENIRKEFWFIDEEAFKSGRTRILKDLLLRSSIYYSDYFIVKYEKKARENLTHSIELLSSGKD